jgi:hypothetical protein
MTVLIVTAKWIAAKSHPATGHTSSSHPATSATFSLFFRTTVAFSA